MANDWFRKTSWTPEDERDFEDRLARSRSQRLEYLRVQAVTLVQTGNRRVAPPAISLAQRYLDEADSSLFVSQAHLIMARAYELLGDTSRATESYRAAVEAQSLPSAARQQAHIDFAWFVATNRLRGLYDEALQTMEENLVERDLVLPLSQYRYFASIALISYRLGDKTWAKRMARNALDAATQTEGPFAKHRELGLVPTDEKTLKRIRRIAG